VTTGAWIEALAYLSEHRRATPDLRAAWIARRPTPDLRGVEYWRVEIVPNGANGHRPPVSVLRRLVAGVFNALTRVALRLN
jgi:hypothetical protein